jgi:hypothetical protein
VRFAAPDVHSPTTLATPTRRPPTPGRYLDPMQATATSSLFTRRTRVRSLVAWIKVLLRWNWRGRLVELFTRQHFARPCCCPRQDATNLRPPVAPLSMMAGLLFSLPRSRQGRRYRLFLATDFLCALLSFLLLSIFWIRITHHCYYPVIG